MATPSQKSYEFLEHTADVRIRVRGQNLTELFTNAAHGMSDYIFGSTSEIPASEYRDIALTAHDEVSLLVDWLSQLLLLTTTLYCDFTRIEFKHLSPTTLTARVGGAKRELLHDIKAVTYYDLEIKQNDGTLEAIITFDI